MKRFLILTTIISLTALGQEPPPPPQISLDTSAVTLTVDETHQFVATLTGIESSDITWEILGATPADPLMPKGTITQSGLYTAPHEFWKNMPVTVKVSSVSQPSVFAVASVTLEMEAIPQSIIVTIDVDGFQFKRALSAASIHALTQFIRENRDLDYLLTVDGELAIENGAPVMGKKYRNIPEVILRHNIETLLAPMLKKYPTQEISTAKQSAIEAQKALDNAALQLSSQPAPQQ